MSDMFAGVLADVVKASKQKVNITEMIAKQKEDNVEGQLAEYLKGTSKSYETTTATLRSLEISGEIMELLQRHENDLALVEMANALKIVSMNIMTHYAHKKDRHSLAAYSIMVEQLQSYSGDLLSIAAMEALQNLFKGGKYGK